MLRTLPLSPHLLNALEQIRAQSHEPRPLAGCEYARELSLLRAPIVQLTHADVRELVEQTAQIRVARAALQCSLYVDPHLPGIPAELAPTRLVLTKHLFQARAACCVETKPLRRAIHERLENLHPQRVALRLRLILSPLLPCCPAGNIHPQATLRCKRLCKREHSDQHRKRLHD
jgi:hypothetical protein